MPLCYTLLGIVLFGAPVQLVEKMLSWAKEKYDLFHLVKMGFTRLSLNYFFDSSTINYVLDCIEWVGKNAWKLLPLYRPQKAWSHFSLLDYDAEYQRKHHLYNISYKKGLFDFETMLNVQTIASKKEAHKNYIELADKVVAEFEHYLKSEQGKKTCG